MKRIVEKCCSNAIQNITLARGSKPVSMLFLFFSFIIFSNVTFAQQSIITAEADTEIWPNFADRNYGNCNKVFVNRSPLQRGLFRFSLSVLPSNAIITGAQLRLEKDGGNNTSHNLSVHAITGAWTEGTGPCGDTQTGNVTWNNRTTGTPWSTLGGDFGATPAASINVAGNGTYNWPITALVIAWKNGTNANNGVLLKFTTEGGSGQEKDFISREGGAGDRPELVVDYTLLTATVSKTNITCNGASDGTITSSITCYICFTNSSC